MTVLSGSPAHKLATGHLLLLALSLKLHLRLSKRPRASLLYSAASVVLDLAQPQAVRIQRIYHVALCLRHEHQELPTERPPKTSRHGALRRNPWRVYAYTTVFL